VKNHSLSNFNRVPARDGQTDGQSDRSTALALIASYADAL